MTCYKLADRVHVIKDDELQELLETVLSHEDAEKICNSMDVTLDDFDDDVIKDYCLCNIPHNVDALGSIERQINEIKEDLKKIKSDKIYDAIYKLEKLESDLNDLYCL